MKFVPVSVSRLAGRSLLKLNASSPTLLVVGGVVGLSATAVLAARATRKVDIPLDSHHQRRGLVKVNHYSSDSARQRAVLNVYVTSAAEFGRLYGPTLVLGVVSAAAVLGGHKILRGRHMATMAAYSGLFEQFAAYRGRVAKTLGDDVEQGIFNGAHGEWKEDPDHKGEHKLEPVFEGNEPASYLRPFFDESNKNWRHDNVMNKSFLTGVQNHMNNLLHIRGHVMLTDVYDALGMERVPECTVAGWLLDGDGDGYVDFGWMSSIEPASAAFRDGNERSVRLNFNIDGVIWDKI